MNETVNVNTREQVEIMAGNLLELTRSYMTQPTVVSPSERDDIVEKFVNDVDAIWDVACEFGLELELEAYLLGEITNRFSSFVNDEKMQQVGSCGSTCEFCNCSRDADRAECEQEGLAE